MSEIGADWEERSFGSLAHYVNGYAFGPNDWSDSGTPIVRIRELLNPEVEPDRYPGVLPGQFRINSGSLVFSWSATLAAIIWDRGPAYLNQHLFNVIPKHGVDRYFLHHLINASIARLAARSHGTTMKHIKRDDLQHHQVALPPMAEQRRVAEILDTLDDQIRATEQIIAKLKVSRLGLLTSVLACGLPPNGRLRCPRVDRASFVKTPLGLRPRTWCVGRLDRWLSAKPKNGYSPVEEAKWSGVSMLGLGCLTIDGFAPRQLKNAPRMDSKLRGVLLSDGDLLMTRANTRELVGFAGIYRDIGHPCTYPDLMMKLAPTPELSKPFLSIVLNSSDIRRQVQNAASGTSGSMVKISAAIVRSLLVPVPPIEEQRRIEDQLQSALEYADTEYRRLVKLQSLKHGIMTDLLTGRVRVPVEATS